MGGCFFSFRCEQSLMDSLVWLEHVVEDRDISLWREHGLGGRVIGLRHEQDV